MSSLIPGSCFIRAALLRICFGFVFVGLAVAAHTAHSVEGSFEPDFDILTIQLAHSDTDWMLPYRLNTTVALTRSTDTAPVVSRFSNSSRLHLVAKPEKETVFATSLHWQQNYDSYRVSLQRLLSLEFKGERANIIFQPRSVLIQVEQLKITLRSQSALIEEGQLKIMLQPHSALVSWGEKF